MNEDFNYKGSSNKKSRTNYKWRLSIFSLFRPMLFSLMLFFSAYITVPILYEVGYLLYFLGVIYSLYVIIYFFSSYLYINQSGIWFKRGFLPWKKGITGVVWHDAGEVGFKNSFIGWVIKAYPIKVTNRYNNQIELSLPFIKNGHKATSIINGYILEFKKR